MIDPTSGRQQDTAADLAVDWRPRARRLAGHATAPGSRWRAAIEATPRHLMVPRWWERHDGRWVCIDGPSDPKAWLEAAYSDRSLVTQVGSYHADHTPPGVRVGGSPTSSSTEPGLMVQMLRHASIPAHERCEVLEVGTGSGYGAAIACHLIGDGRLTSIDVDPYLVKAAEERLTRIGHLPRLTVADATMPLDGEWDRIVATVSLCPIPPSLLAALRTGGRLVTTITNTSLILTAEKQDDGSAIGRIERDTAMFMRTRDYPPADPALLKRARARRGEDVRHGGYPVMELVEAWEVRSMLEILAPGIEHHYAETSTEESEHRMAVMTHPDGSWARAEQSGDQITIHQGGPRRLWNYLDEVRDMWLRHGRLPLYGAQALIHPDGSIRLRRGTWSATIGRQTPSAPAPVRISSSVSPEGHEPVRDEHVGRQAAATPQRRRDISPSTRRTPTTPHRLLEESMRLAGIKVVAFDCGGTICGNQIDHLLGEKPVDPDAANTLHALRRMGKKLAVASDTLPGEPRWPALAKAEVDDLFEGAALSYWLGFGKADPRFWGVVAAIGGCRADQVMMVGNRLDYDVVNPLENGIGAAALLRPDGLLPGEALPEGAIMIHHLSQLVPLLAGQALS
ncbi:HAD family hydrolase [Nonomuraea sp. NPDC026600]|uniref:HAD family hydrolase n=1 Tax=Nonomuraea sp. NPDC026600 TaxID=3155363 RepID=UPI0033EA663B